MFGVPPASIPVDRQARPPYRSTRSRVPSRLPSVDDLFLATLISAEADATMSSPSSSSTPPTSAEAPAPRRGLFRAIREALRGEHHDFTQGSLPRAIWLLAVPMVIELLGESVFALADIYFVSSVSDAAAAAVGITESMLTLVYAVAFGLAMSATALVARRIGEGNVDGAVRAATAAIAVGVIGGVLVGIPGFLFAVLLIVLFRENVVAVGVGWLAMSFG